MTTDLRCPRCLGPARPPGLRTSRWTCGLHGEVAPLHPARTADAAQLSAAASRSHVPLWLPWPLPVGWVATGVQVAGDEHGGTVATVVALAGPNPLRYKASDALAADLLVVAEQPGVGLAARLAGIDDVDAGQALAVALGSGVPPLPVQAAGHAVPLWSIDGHTDRAVFGGEASSVWLWLIVHPAEAGALVLDDLRLVDLRDPGHPLDVPAGALSPRLP